MISRWVELNSSRLCGSLKEMQVSCLSHKVKHTGFVCNNKDISYFTPLQDSLHSQIRAILLNFCAYIQKCN